MKKRNNDRTFYYKVRAFFFNKNNNNYNLRKKESISKHLPNNNFTLFSLKLKISNYSYSQYKMVLLFSLENMREKCLPFKLYNSNVNKT